MHRIVKHLNKSKAISLETAWKYKNLQTTSPNDTSIARTLGQEDGSIEAIDSIIDMIKSGIYQKAVVNHFKHMKAKADRNYKILTDGYILEDIFTAHGFYTIGRHYGASRAYGYALELIEGLR